MSTTFDNQTESFRDEARTLKNDAQDLASDALDFADETIEDVREQSGKIVELVGDFVAQRPLVTIGIAAAAGFVLAKLLRL